MADGDDAPTFRFRADSISELKFLDPTKLPFVRDWLTVEETKGLAGQLHFPGKLSLRSANVSVLLPLLHDARSHDEKRFMTSLFLPWVTIQRSVMVHRERILNEFARIGDFEAGTQQELAHL